MTLMKIGIGILVALCIVILAASITRISYVNAELTARSTVCQGSAQLVAAEIQAIQVGNPQMSAPESISTTVSLQSSPLGTVDMQESGTTLTTTTTVGGIPCLTDRIPIQALSLSDNATIARPTPTP